MFIIAKKRTRSKYHVDITEKGKRDRTYKGIQYDSKTEMQFYIEYVEPKIASGEILSCDRQVEYVLQDSFIYNGKKILPVKYISDFDLIWRDKTKQVIDVKGNPDNLSLLKRKLFWYKYPEYNLTFMCRNLKFGGWVEFNELKKLRREDKKKKCTIGK